MLCICPCLSLPCCVLSLCPLGAGPTGEFTPQQQAKSTKAQVTMMLRRVLCVLFLALCCACVCATAQEEGQYDVAVVEAGEGQDQTTTTTPPQHTNYYYDDHHHQCTRQDTTHLQGTDSWRRERPRRPFVGSGAAAAACQCRCGDRRCCVLRTGRGACAALGVTHREVRRVF
ncbi:putative mucin TcSMUGS [Trypanosoma cruzi]|uniref:Putative mucin TcSMUGS n=1 Tax=Trypanosoma cruzi TaxID=5693 RepID=A0A2V2V1D4_TRYCR|nr:putative mucin TcSMUGS [Trypanosoma cruzi]